MKEFRLLKPEEIECRVSNVSEYGATLLLYKTARIDADLLDEKYGPFGWQNDFKLVDGVLYGGIGIKDGSGSWIWKYDAGTESNTEAEKGRASDAFKRAGFKWGIGRELYSAPRTFIPADKCKVKKNEKTGKWQCFDVFDVSEIDYDEQQRICYLKIELKGKTVFEWGEPKDPEKYNKALGQIICADCGKVIRSRKKKDGSVWEAKDIAAYTRAIAGRDLCVECGKAEQARQEQNAS